MRKVLTYIFTLLYLTAIGQNERILSFDLRTGIVDTLNLVDYDTSIIREQTNYFLGKINNEYNSLSEEVPTENTYPESNFTQKKRSSIEYENDKFPIRTSVKLFSIENDSLKGNCSGSIISRKHVLTACHCVAPTYIDSLLIDSLFVSPIYDNGEFSSLLDGSWVEKIYIFENWDFQKDFTILQMENPIGENTGWISIGFDSDDDNLLDGIFYKFSYPATTIPQIDSNSYNGDTLYFSYGLADFTTQDHIMISNATGIPGESGSSLIKIDNENSYTSYGVLSFSNNLRHCKLTNWKYFALKEIIKNDLSINLSDIKLEDNICVYPNPSNEKVHIYLPREFKNNTSSIMNLTGNIIKKQSNTSNEIDLNLSDLPSGIYILMIESKNRIITRKVIKNGG